MCLASTASLGAQATGTPAPRVHVLKLTGTVLDTTQIPVASANVELIGLGKAISTDAGLFSFSGVPGDFVLLHVTKIGFQPLLKVIRLPKADSLDVDVTLRPRITQLDPIVVREDSTFNRFSDPTGFQRRMRNSAGGYYMTADQISRVPVWQTSQLVRRFPGVTVSPRGQIGIDRGSTTLIGSSCNGVMILIDGIFSPDFDIDMIPVSAIRGIEVYSGAATTPMELRSGRTPCGSVAIWTR
jgi:hypothetical protein